MTLRQLLRRKGVRGVCLGSCVSGQRLPADVAGHAHLNIQNEKWPGYICIRDGGQLLARGSNRVSSLLLHELAHLIANQGHGDAWRESMRELGQPIPAQYRKRSKP